MPERSSARLHFNGKDPVGFLADLEAAMRPTEDELRHAGELLRTRILLRTARGVDVNDRPFAPYATNSPFYYYPNGRGSSRQRSAKRLQQKIGGTLSRSGAGIRFASYAAFKASLGRGGGVDLRGPRAPHMLQAMVVEVHGQTIVIAIYGEEAERASGHNDGLHRHLPQREFMGATAEDLALIERDVMDRITARLRRRLA